MREWKKKDFLACQPVIPPTKFLWREICPDGFVCVKWDEFGKSWFFNALTSQVMIKQYNPLAPAETPEMLWIPVEEFTVW